MIDDGASNLNVYVGEDGFIHFTDWAGADSVLPFSSGDDLDSFINSLITGTTRVDQINYSNGSYTYTCTNCIFIGCIDSAPNTIVIKAGSKRYNLLSGGGWNVTMTETSITGSAKLWQMVRVFYS